MQNAWYKIMMIVKLHDFLVVKTNDGEVVMKVREHCFAGVWKNSPLKVVNTDVAGLAWDGIAQAISAWSISEVWELVRAHESIEERT